ncbi:MAG: hypothetical protein WCC57_12695 [Paracoccaceae bacterium]
MSICGPSLATLTPRSRIVPLCAAAKTSEVSKHADCATIIAKADARRVDVTFGNAPVTPTGTDGGPLVASVAAQNSTLILSTSGNHPTCDVTADSRALITIPDRS